jgi:hypothetical protein
MPSKSCWHACSNSGIPAPIDIIDVLDSSIGTAQESPQLLFAIQQAFTAAILPITHEKIERQEARIISTMEEQISELWPTTSIERANLAVEHGSGGWQASGDQFL